MTFAYFQPRRFEMALSWANKSLARQKNYTAGLRAAMMNYAMMGRITDAQMIQARLREAGADITISQLKRWLLFQRQEDIELIVEAYRLVGVPE